jgi:beta-glucanase (GH16 family)
MKWIWVLGMLALVGCNLQSNHSGSYIIAPKGYELVWSDEFEIDGKPDEQFWNYEEGFVRNEELQWYSSKNVFIEDGILVFEARREEYDNPNYNPTSDDWRYNREFINYTSGLIKTNGKFSFQYGIVEVKAKIDTSMGSWPAIWTLGNERRWPGNGEIDILEFYRVNGEPKILANVAWSVDDSWNAVWGSEVIAYSEFLEKDPRWGEKFHVWKMVWDEDFIRLYVDDEMLNEVDLTKTIHPNGFNPFHQPHYLLLNLAVGSNGGDPYNTEFPIRYEIDYLRVFQKK